MAVSKATTLTGSVQFLDVHIVNIEQLRIGPVFPLQKAFSEALERRDAVWASSTLLYLSGVVQHSISSTDCVYSPSRGTWSYRDYHFLGFLVMDTWFGYGYLALDFMDF